MSTHRDFPIVKLPLDQPDPLEPPAGLRDLQLRGSVHAVITAVGDPGWLVTGRTEALAWLDDDRLGRSHPDPARAARTGESMLFGGPSGAFDTEMADHTRMRALLQPHFTPARMRALRPRVQQLTGELLDSMAAGDRPSDLVQAVAVPLPVLVICELLGVPASDRDRFRAWTRDAANVADRQRSMAGLGALFSYGQQLVAAKQDQPADDVISRLAATPGVGALEAAQLSMFLLFAGHETTVDQIGKGALQLLAAAGQWTALARDPSRVPAAVEEILRTTDKGGGGIPRYARENVQIGGVEIAAGELVIFDIGAANHDPAAFADPDRFDPGRDNRRHLAFGHGLRYCIGAPLARIELQVVFTALTGRFPDLRLAADPRELTVDTDTLTRSLARLPVTW
jgi:cytochrome P450